MCFSKQDIKCYDDLVRLLELNNVDKSLWSDKCDYMDPSKCNNLNPDNFNFVLLQLNIQSILAHQSELHSVLQLLADKHLRADFFILCETFVLSKTNQLVNIPGYSIIVNSRHEHKGGGVAILIRDGVTFKKCPNLNLIHEKEVESVHAEIWAKMEKLLY